MTFIDILFILKNIEFKVIFSIQLTKVQRYDILRKHVINLLPVYI